MIDASPSLEPISAEQLIERLTELQSRIGKMCSERRGPRMSIPVDPIRDDDVFICDTIRMAKDALKSRAPSAEGRLRASLRAIELRVDGLNTRAFRHKTATQAVLDAIKAHCHAALRGEP